MSDLNQMTPQDVDQAFSRVIAASENASENGQKTQGFDRYLNANFQGSDGESEDRSKTSRRMQYEAECQVIRRKMGGLENVRQELGLSRRKMAQLLMVDPSAWTRWTQDESKVPPHVIRSLQWYLALIEKQPEWHPMNAYLGAFRGGNSGVSADLQRQMERLRSQEEDAKRYLEDRLSALKMESHEMQRKIQEKDQIGVGWKFLLVLNLLLCLYLILF